MRQYDPAYPAQRANDPSTWFIDSGCSGHMTRDLSSFHECHKLRVTVPIEFGGGEIVPATGYGDITLPNGMRIVSVLHVPALKVSLLSISAMLNLGLDVLFSSSGRDVVLQSSDPVLKNETSVFRILQSCEYYLYIRMITSFRGDSPDISPNTLSLVQSPRPVRCWLPASPQRVRLKSGQPLSYS